MAQNLDALKSAVKVVAHAVSDSIKAAKDTTAAARMAEYSNLLPDVMELLPKIGDLSLTNLAPSDYVSLVQELATDLVVPDAHAAAIIQASMKLIEDLVPDVLALVAAIKNAQNPVPVAAK